MFLYTYIFLILQRHSSIGSTYEGRAIPVVKVTGDAPAGSKQKVIVVGYVHEGRRGEERRRRRGRGEEMEIDSFYVVG